MISSAYPSSIYDLHDMNMNHCYIYGGRVGLSDAIKACLDLTYVLSTLSIVCTSFSVFYDTSSVHSKSSLSFSASCTFSEVKLT